MENENMEIETEEGLVTLKLKPEDALRLKSILSRRDNLVKRPKVSREGNKIIIDTGLDDGCFFNKGTPQEIRVLRVFQRAGSHDIDEGGRAINPVAAITVVETIEGNYVYMNNQPVSKLEDLEIIPKAFRQAAMTWWEKKYGSKEADKEAVSVPSNGSKSFDELALKERVIILSAKGLSGKEISKKLKCNEGTVSVHKKTGIKAKLLSKDGKKFTPAGLEKYGQIEI